MCVATLIDPEVDRLTRVCELVKQRLGKYVSPSTTWRWRLKGVKVGDRRVKLECVRLAGCWYTTEKALAEFIRAQSERPTPNDSDAPAKRDARTERRLQEAGLA